MPKPPGSANTDIRKPPVFANAYLAEAGAFWRNTKRILSWCCEYENFVVLIDTCTEPFVPRQFRMASCHSSQFKMPRPLHLEHCIWNHGQQHYLMAIRPVTGAFRHHNLSRISPNVLAVSISNALNESSDSRAREKSDKK